MLERVLGNFDEKSLVKKAIGGIIGAVIVCLSLGMSGNLEEPVLYFFFSFWLAVGIIYGINVIRSIMSGCYMTEDFMAKWLVLGVALIIGVIAGGIKEEMLVKCADELIDDREQLQQYLKDIYTIETERYSLQEAEEELKYRIENAGQAQVQEGVESYYTYYFKEYLGNLKFTFILGIGVTALVFTILILMDFLTNDAPYWIGTGIGKITILIAIVLPTVKFIQSERKEVGEYEVRKENNRKAVEEDKVRIENELAEVPNYKKNMNECRKNIVDCEEKLQKLYDVGVLFPKYREFVCVSQLLEYLLSGRCEDLTGYTGAYNLYEQELRMNIIIAELELISEELDAIKENQYMIYNAICQANYLLREVTDNTAIAAYNTEVIATNMMIYNRYYY